MVAEQVETDDTTNFVGGSFSRPPSRRTWMTFRFSARNDLSLKALAACRVAMDVLGNSVDIEVALEACINCIQKRATLASCQGQFVKARQMAYQTVDIVPLRKEGYMLVARIHSLEGKSDKALTMYREGIAKCGPIADLERGAQDAQAAHQRRIDFLSRFPLDIVDIIAQNLSTPDKVTCMTVSKVWQSKIGACSMAWQSINEFPLDEPSIHLKEVLFADIRHLRFTRRRYTDGSITACIRMLTDYNVTWLHTLELNPTGDMPNVNAEDILHAVQTNRQTLKSITLPIPGGGRATRTALFEFLLTGCPRLQRLVCGFYGLRDVSWWLDRDEGWHGPGGMASPIVELGLLDMARLQTYALDRVLAVCPNLRRLHLIGASSSAINSILEICHNLRILSFNLPFEVEYPMPPYEDDHGQGLQVLNLCHDAVFRSDERLSQAVGSIFDRYHNTIREIVLHGMRRSFKLNHLCRGLEHAHSHSLRRLHLALSSFDEKTIGAMISRFPNLEDVTAKLNFLADSTICTSLGQLSKLRSLTLRHCPRNSLEEEVAEEDDCAIHLGNLFCNLRNRNTLNTLCLHTMPFETRVCLKYLQGICLEKLVMWELAFPASTEEMHGFLNSSLTVRHLELHNTLCITDALCKQIRTIRGLQEIYIRYLYNVGDAGFLALTATDDLRWIKVRNCRHISQTAIDKASGLIPIFTSHAE